MTGLHVDPAFAPLFPPTPELPLEDAPADPLNCPHESGFDSDGPDPSVGIFGWVHVCHDCGADVDLPEPDYDGDYADLMEDEVYDD